MASNSIPHPESETQWYRVTFISGILVRAEPRADGPQTGLLLPQHTIFSASEAVLGADGRVYLHLADGRGWVFDDGALFFDDPSVIRISGKEATEAYNVALQNTAMQQQGLSTTAPSPPHLCPEMLQPLGLPPAPLHCVEPDGVVMPFGYPELLPAFSDTLALDGILPMDYAHPNISANLSCPPGNWQGGQQPRVQPSFDPAAYSQQFFESVGTEEPRCPPPQFDAALTLNRPAMCTEEAPANDAQSDGVALLAMLKRDQKRSADAEECSPARATGPQQSGAVLLALLKPDSDVRPARCSQAALPGKPEDSDSCRSARSTCPSLGRSEDSPSRSPSAPGAAILSMLKTNELRGDGVDSSSDSSRSETGRGVRSCGQGAALLSMLQAPAANAKVGSRPASKLHLWS